MTWAVRYEQRSCKVMVANYGALQLIYTIDIFKIAYMK
jgi:hypothetical protein